LQNFCGRGNIKLWVGNHANHKRIGEFMREKYHFENVRDVREYLTGRGDAAETILADRSYVDELAIDIARGGDLHAVCDAALAREQAIIDEIFADDAAFETNNQ